MTGPKYREKRFRVLRFIALNGPNNKHQVETNIRPTIDHPTIHKIVVDLEAHYLIEFDNSKKNLLAKFYRLTKRGILQLIYDENEIQKQAEMMRLLTKKYFDMFDFFRLWPAVIRVGLENLGLEVLSSACQRTLVNAFDYSKAPPVPVEPYDPTPIFLDPFRLGTIHGTMRDRGIWLKAIARDSDLREATAKVLRQKALRDLQVTNETLQILSLPGIGVVSENQDEIQEVKTLHEKIEALQVAVGMLQEQSGLKVVRVSHRGVDAGLGLSFEPKDMIGKVLPVVRAAMKILKEKEAHEKKVSAQKLE